MLKIIGNKSYEYRSVKVGGRATKRYLGRGPDAETACLAIARSRAQAIEARHRWASFLSAEAEADARIDAALDGAELATDALMIVAGFHRPRRKPWRRMTTCPTTR
jgi:hypothetical protein